MIISPVFEKKKLSWGLQGERIINRIPKTLLTPCRPQCSRTRPPWRPSGCQKFYGGSCLESFHSLQKNRGCRGAWIINKIHHNNFNSLKAIVDEPHPQQPLEQNPKHFGLLEGLYSDTIRSPSPTTALESSTSTRQEWLHPFLSLSSSKYCFHVIQKNKLIFERETIFVSISRDDPVYNNSRRRVVFTC